MLSVVKRWNVSKTRRKVREGSSLREIRLVPNADLKPNEAGRLSWAGRSYRVRAIEGSYAFLEPLATD